MKNLGNHSIFTERSELERLVTGRNSSLFLNDFENRKQDIQKRLKNKSVLIIGAAGSIGAAVTKRIAEFSIGKMSLIDVNENGLAEVVRDLRSSSLSIPEDFSAIPIALGSQEFKTFIQRNNDFDFILNFSALKHVRSEKDLYSISRMLKTNVTYVHDLLDDMGASAEKYFSISSDKAVEPANIMGASKLLMEKCLEVHSDRVSFSTARFANVAFSAGSLPDAFLQRLQKRQPLSGPKNIRRYFISHVEAAELCILSCLFGNNREIFFPRLEENLNEVTFYEIALRLLESYGLEPLECQSEEEAKERMQETIGSKYWPCYFSNAQTSGEKEYEEFFYRDEKTDLSRFENIGVICNDINNSDLQKESVLKLLKEIPTWIEKQNISRKEIIEKLTDVLPGFQHQEKNKSLDEIM